MYAMKCSLGHHFSHGSLTPLSSVSLNPAASVLNYAQGVFEGLKAQRSDEGRILLFRPEENARRMKMGAERMCMPCPSVEQFVNAVKHTVIANRRWVPPPGKGSLYIRPLLIASGVALGLRPPPEFTFLTYASPVNSYHKSPLDLKVENKLFRAITGHGGTGGIKSIANYAPVFRAINEAKIQGFSDVLFLDAATANYIEEVSSSNVFVVKVMERDVEVEETLQADEVFCTGTAMGVKSVASVTYNNRRVEYKTGADSVCQKLYDTLVGIQTGLVETTKNWIVQVD
ncbi:branched-chain-amino-acid aminotransferase 2, chloroplastic-like [Neltuma alba]|uniref:branched-chain-amino-acid aminotransferase 2, chloroplastic-like n=1 Tax=Neltuma alba TaxID=207710 RepID=UPI0010A4C4B5|nr:branched-chain-amino-acid aminotransferase 2, chloroplastic-like [Prosopis alba]